MRTFWQIADILSTWAIYTSVVVGCWLAFDALICLAFHAYRAHIADDWMDLADAVQDDDDFTAWAREMTA